MRALAPSYTMDETSRVITEICPACGNPMRLAAVVPRVAGHPELRSFKCMSCNEVITKPVDKTR